MQINFIHALLYVRWRHITTTVLMPLGRIEGEREMVQTLDALFVHIITISVHHLEWPSKIVVLIQLLNIALCTIWPFLLH